MRLLRTRAFDSDEMKAFLGRLAQQIGGGGEKQQRDDFMKQFTMALDSRAGFAVEDGMTRAVRQDDMATASVPGHSVVTHGHKLITVTPAP